MSKARLEHVNLTVTDPLVTAAMLVDVFDWRIRWQGDAIHGGLRSMLVRQIPMWPYTRAGKKRSLQVITSIDSRA